MHIDDNNPSHLRSKNPTNLFRPTHESVEISDRAPYLSEPRTSPHSSPHPISRKNPYTTIQFFFFHSNFRLKIHCLCVVCVCVVSVRTPGEWRSCDVPKLKLMNRFLVLSSHDRTSTLVLKLQRILLWDVGFLCSSRSFPVRYSSEA